MYSAKIIISYNIRKVKRVEMADLCLERVVFELNLAYYRSMRKMIFVIGVVAIFVAAGVVGWKFFKGGTESTWVCENGEWVRQGLSLRGKPKETCGETTNQETKDEHGCLVAADYVWCEERQKCLKASEEDCVSGVMSDEGAIKTALVKRNGWEDEQAIELTIVENNGTFARGGVGDPAFPGTGGLWFAKKVGGEWKIVWDGNGIVKCGAMREYEDFPASMIPQCYDEASGELVGR